MFRNLVTRIISKWRIRKGQKFLASSKIVLRKARVEDFVLLDEIRGSSAPKLHTERLREQAEKKSLYLLAFIEEISVGHIYVVFKGTQEYHTSPVLQDLYVKKELREQKLGTKIIREAERALKELGHDKVSLDVETRNEWIRKIYEKQGFKLKSGPHRQVWTDLDSGERVRVEASYLEKRI